MKAITADSTIKEVVGQKGMKARILIDEFFKPNGGSPGNHHTLWGAAEFYNGKQACLPNLIRTLNAMPDQIPA